MYLDENNLIVQKDGDGGDTAARTGFYYTALYLQHYLFIKYLDVNPFASACRHLITDAGLIRNPIKWNDPKDCSRDQTTPMLIACGFFDYQDYVEQIRPKWLRYQNKDVASPQNLNEVRRAQGKKPSLFGDLWALGGVLVRIHQAKKDLDDVGDDLNLLISLTQGYLVKSTFISRFALRYYLKNRPNNMSAMEDHVKGALQWYFRAESGGNPEIAYVWFSIIDRLRELCGL